MACISILHGHRVLGTMDKLDHTKVQYCEISKYQGQREHHTSFERERGKNRYHTRIKCQNIIRLLHNLLLKVMKIEKCPQSFEKKITSNLQCFAQTNFQVWWRIEYMVLSLRDL